MLHRLSLPLAIVFLLVNCCAYAQDTTLRTGPYETTGTAKDILGKELSSKYSHLIDLDLDITWEIDVPDDYDPKNPPGVMVYISPQNIVNLPTGWLDVTDEKNLIFIAARMSGNNEPVGSRIVMALLALPLVQSSYTINTDRIFISGFSGGGRVASMVSTSFPHIFKGALYSCGANFWQDVNIEQMENIQNNRFVFLTGTNDFNLNDTKKVYSKYKKAGATNSKLMVIPRMGHSNPKRTKFAQAIEYLDAAER
tara:strand:+ start:1283 stop:2041 length:759 start_codon:yes stop_codon:yes gene_type:complete